LDGASKQVLSCELKKPLTAAADANAAKVAFCWSPIQSKSQTVKIRDAPSSGFVADPPDLFVLLAIRLGCNISGESPTPSTISLLVYRLSI